MPHLLLKSLVLGMICDSLNICWVDKCTPCASFECFLNGYILRDGEHTRDSGSDLEFGYMFRGCILIIYIMCRHQLCTLSHFSFYAGLTFHGSLFVLIFLIASFAFSRHSVSRGSQHHLLPRFSCQILKIKIFFPVASLSLPFWYIFQITHI